MGKLFREMQEYVVPFRIPGQPAGALPRTARLAAKPRPSDRSNERRSVMRVICARRADDFAIFTLAPLPNQHPIFYHEVFVAKLDESMKTIESFSFSSDSEMSKRN